MMGRAGAALVLLGTLTACSDRDKSAFVEACSAAIGSAAECDCAYDLGRDSLTDAQFEVYKALILQDAQAEAKARAELGVLGAAAAYSRILWVAANGETACPG